MTTGPGPAAVLPPFPGELFTETLTEAPLLPPPEAGLGAGAGAPGEFGPGFVLTLITVAPFGETYGLSVGGAHALLT